MTMYKKCLFSFIIGFLCASCTTVPPFEEEPLVPINLTPLEIRQNADKLYPHRFKVLSSVTFKYFGHSMSAMGLTIIDEESGDYSVILLNPMGIKIFELVVENDKVKSLYAIEDIHRMGGDITIIGEDIKRAYFQRVPSLRSTVSCAETLVTFSENIDEGTLNHVFGGENFDLREKILEKNGEKLWSVRYYDYREKNNESHPFGIYLENYDHGYQLIIRLKENYDYE